MKKKPKRAGLEMIRMVKNGKTGKCDKMIKSAKMVKSVEPLGGQDMVKISKPTGPEIDTNGKRNDQRAR